LPRHLVSASRSSAFSVQTSYTSSITAPENAKLDGLAKITPEQAAAAAASATGGTAGKVELENEDGDVVYAVEVTQPDGTKLEAKVDAGNGNILRKEVADAHESADSGEHAKSHEAGEQPDATDALEQPDGND